MKMARNKNYWLAFFGCLSCTVLTLTTRFSWESFNRLFMSDLNVVVWLFVAWLFDDQRPN